MIALKIACVIWGFIIIMAIVIVGFIRFMAYLEDRRAAGKGK